MVILYILGIEFIIYLFLLVICKIPDCLTLLGGLKNKLSPPPPSYEEEDEYYGDKLTDNFLERIDKLKTELKIDVDGLYDIEDVENDEFTGTEIITESREVELDRY